MSRSDTKLSGGDEDWDDWDNEEDSVEHTRGDSTNRKKAGYVADLHIDYSKENHDDDDDAVDNTFDDDDDDDADDNHGHVEVSEDKMLKQTYEGKQDVKDSVRVKHESPSPKVRRNVREVKEHGASKQSKNPSESDDDSGDELNLDDYLNDLLNDDDDDDDDEDEEEKSNETYGALERWRQRKKTPLKTKNQRDTEHSAFKDVGGSPADAVRARLARLRNLRGKRGHEEDGDIVSEDVHDHDESKERARHIKPMLYKRGGAPKSHISSANKAFIAMMADNDSSDGDDGLDDLFGPGSPPVANASRNRAMPSESGDGWATRPAAELKSDVNWAKSSGSEERGRKPRVKDADASKRQEPRRQKKDADAQANDRRALSDDDVVDRDTSPDRERIKSRRRMKPNDSYDPREDEVDRDLRSERERRTRALRKLKSTSEKRRSHKNGRHRQEDSEYESESAVRDKKSRRRMKSQDSREHDDDSFDDDEEDEENDRRRRNRRRHRRRRYSSSSDDDDDISEDSDEEDDRRRRRRRRRRGKRKNRRQRDRQSGRRGDYSSESDESDDDAASHIRRKGGVKDRSRSDADQGAITESSTKEEKSDDVTFTDMYVQARDADTTMDALKKFVARPVSKDVGGVMCYIKRHREHGTTIYRVFVEGSNEFLFVGKRRKNKRTANYIVSVHSGDLSRESPGYCGKVRGNMLGSSFTVYDSGASPKEMRYVSRNQAKKHLRKELAGIKYMKHISLSLTPREMLVGLPAVDSEGVAREVCPTSEGAEQQLLEMLSTRDRRLSILENKAPRYNEATKTYILDFGGRVTMASVKNFQLVEKSNDANEVLLQFGRCSEDRFTMDFRYPMSPLQAFGIVLSCFEA